MINLIPPHARKQVKVEYWVRVVSVWMLLSTAACVMIALLLIPSWVLIRSQLSVYDGAYQTANSQNNIYQALESDVRTANVVAKKLSTQDAQVLFTTLISDLESTADNTVTLHSISIQRIPEGKIENVQIVGSANSRVALVQFRDALEAHASFESAELPLSNLAKDKDVPFNITVVVNNDLYQ